MSEAYKTCKGQEQYGFYDWVKQHKKPIIVGCCIVVATVAGVLIYKKLSLPKSSIERLKPLHQLEREALSQQLKIECPKLPSVDPITKSSVVEVTTCLNIPGQIKTVCRNAVIHQLFYALSALRGLPFLMALLYLPECCRQHLCQCPACQLCGID